MEHRVAWHIGKSLAVQGCRCLEDLATLYESYEEVKCKAPKDLGFLPGNEGFDSSLTKLHSIRLMHCIQEARMIREVGSSRRQMQQGSHAGETTHLLSDETRRYLEETYSVANGGRPPPIQYQGADDYLLQQLRECEEGQIGWFSRYEIRGKLDDPGQNSQNRQSIPLDDEACRRGNAKEIEKRMIFRTTLLMCISANVHHKTLDIDKTKLDEWYEWFEIHTSLSHMETSGVHALECPERNAWMRINLKVRNLRPLSKAMEEVKNELLQETYHRKHLGDPAEQPPERKTWARRTVTGKLYCLGWNKGRCKRKMCGRVHRCCLIIDGRACHRAHRAEFCDYASWGDPRDT